MTSSVVVPPAGTLTQERLWACAAVALASSSALAASAMCGVRCVICIKFLFESKKYNGRIVAGFKAAANRVSDAPGSAAPERPFRSCFDSSKARQTVRWGRFPGLGMAFEKRARRARPGYGPRVLWRPGRNARIGAMKSSAASWVEVVRLRTLPASIAPVLLGAGIAFALGAASWTRALLAWRWLCKRAAI